MTAIPTVSSNPIKLYSQRAIGIATYIGGPLAAAFLVRRNYINLGKEDLGLYSLFIGVISTFLLGVAFYLVPEDVLNKIPDAVYPAIYTVIIYFVVERFQGQTLKKHKEEKGEFYSGWNAAGAGALCFVFYVALFLAYVYLAPAGQEVEKYNEGLAEFQQNEDTALKLYDLVDLEDTKQIEEFIQRTGLPYWNKNIELLAEMDRIEGLPSELIEQNKILREYCELRIESYQLIRKGLNENSDEYEQRLGEINEKIDLILARL